MVQVNFDVAAIRQMGSAVGRSGTSVGESMSRFVADAQAVESKSELGSDQLVHQYASVTTDWIKNLHQIVSSLACIGEKLGVAADTYEAADGASGGRP